MKKLETLQRIVDHGMVAIVRADSADDALKLAEACIAGGMAVLEVALTTPGALDVIEQLGQRHGDAVLLGAGTVLDPESARLAILAGARFIISPAVNLATLAMCKRYQVVAMPGALTPAEIVLALEGGADIVKVFPADTFGPGYIKALRAPLPQAPLMPTGGVTLENLRQWFDNGSVAVGIGGSLTNPAASGDYAAVTRIATEFVRRKALA
jgi:2-dehydro-3-deoxyphosphogluconate aldolase/(4S)-4-hydroxy-2-oxoglutarate aldolase